jgi:hypothetical protein
MCAYRACAAGSEGVMWASHRGIMFYDGSKVTKIADYVDGGLTRPTFADGEKPKMAYLAGKYYFLSGDDLYWFDAQAAVWGCDTMGPIGSLGIQAFQLGDKQSHILCGRTWDTSTSAEEEITVLHTGEQYSQFAGAGSSTSSLYAPIDIIFAPLVPEPDEQITGMELWLDATWTVNDVTADIPHVYWSNDKMVTWNDAGAAVQQGKVVLRQDAIGRPLYLRIAANYAKDFQLYGAKVIIRRSQVRGTATA